MSRTNLIMLIGSLFFSACFPRAIAQFTPVSTAIPVHYAKSKVKAGMLIQTSPSVTLKPKLSLGGLSSSSEIFLPLVTHQIPWRPPLGVKWQIQFSGDINLNVDASLLDLDLFESDNTMINELHFQGKKVICYFSAGSWEAWRPDAEQFPPDVIGNDYYGWQGEKWLDVRQIEALAPILRARLDLCKAKGFDGVDADNLDGYSNDTGFSIDATDQLTFNRWLAQEAHQRSLAIGLKNDPEQAAQLEPFFDWSLIESCFSQNWCGLEDPFLTSAKPVLAIEYTDEWDNNQFQTQICTANSYPGISVILKHRELDEWFFRCK